MLFHWLAAVENDDYDWSNLTASSGLIPNGKKGSLFCLAKLGMYNCFDYTLHNVYKKKLYPLKFKLSASYCTNFIALNAWS